MVENSFFPEIKGNFGFGCMRLPMRDGEVDREEFSKMADAFIDAGFNYFDTAHGYLGGKSETAIRECVSARHKREEFLLTNKLSDSYFKTTEDIRSLVLSQLELCGVDYFDFYLMHAQNRENYKKYKATKAYETAYALKEEGLIRHFGLSFHDSPEVLDTILTEHPEVEVVQIQLNYIDWNDASVNSRGVYEVCEKHSKPVIVMEPVKGGSLVNLPEEAANIFKELGGNSNAGYALRFAAGFPNITMVLSGMSNLEQMNDNLSTMDDFKPLDIKEADAVARVCGVFKKLNLIPCTACRYCVDQNTCPMDIQIPLVFAALNSFETFKTWNSKFYYNNVAVREHGKAGDCLKCGMCEEVCPQHLEIRALLEKAADIFENRKG